MADISFAPGTSGHLSTPFPAPRSAGDPVPDSAARSTLERVERAWTALSSRRRTLVVVGAVAVLGVGAVATRVVSAPIAAVIVFVGLLAATAAVVDQHEQRIPNTIITIALATVLGAAAAMALLGDGWTVVDVFVSLAMAAFPLWAVRYGKGLALGDVKLAAVLGATVGLVHPFAGLFLVWCAALASGVFALKTHRNRLVLGPWLWAGYVTAGAAAVVFVQVLEKGGHAWPARP